MRKSCNRASFLSCVAHVDYASTPVISYDLGISIKVNARPIFTSALAVRINQLDQS